MNTVEPCSLAQPIVSGKNLNSPFASIDLDPQVLQATLGHHAVDHQLMLLIFGMALTTGLRDLNAAMVNQDWREAGEVAHHLKANAQAVGASRLAEAMEQAERAALANQTDILLALHADLPHLVSAFEVSQNASLH